VGVNLKVFAISER